MPEGLEFPAPQGGDYFSSDIRSLISQETRNIESDRNQALVDQFSPQVYRDTFRDQISHSLQVPEEYANSEEGSSKLEEISNYLQFDRKVEQLQDISKELVKVLASISLKENRHDPKDMVEGIWELIQHQKQRRRMEHELGRGDRIWPKGQ